MAAIGRTMDAADRFCLVESSVRPFLRYQVMSFSEELFRTALYPKVRSDLMLRGMSEFILPYRYLESSFAKRLIAQKSAEVPRCCPRRWPRPNHCR